MNFENRAADFLRDLKRIEAEEISRDGYTRLYLKHLVSNIEYYAAIYKRILGEVLNKTGKKAGEINLVDYGCGNGLLGLFAWYCGFRRITFMDINKQFLDAAQELCEKVNAKDLSIVHGEIGALVKEGRWVDAIVGTDVIEHIYNIDDFFLKAKELNAAMVTVFSTAANPFNPIIVNRLGKLQFKDEFYGNEGNDLSGDAHPPFILMRKEMIAREFPGVNDIDTLAATTRGLAGEDIFRAVAQYQLTKRLPTPEHRSNTCNPVTGSWTERIMSFRQYKDLYATHGFSMEMSAGFYNAQRTGIRGMAGKICNALISVLGKTFSPFIIITGFKK